MSLTAKKEELTAATEASFELKVGEYGQGWQDVEFSALQLAALIRFARRTSQLSQEELACLSDLTQGRISQLENATTDCPASVLVRLVQACGGHLSLTYSHSALPRPVEFELNPDDQHGERTDNAFDIKHSDSKIKRRRA